MKTKPNFKVGDRVRNTVYLYSRIRPEYVQVTILPGTNGTIQPGIMAAGG